MKKLTVLLTLGAILFAASAFVTEAKSFGKNDSSETVFAFDEQELIGTPVANIQVSEDFHFLVVIIEAEKEEIAKDLVFAQFNSVHVPLKTQICGRQGATNPVSDYKLLDRIRGPTIG